MQKFKTGIIKLHKWNARGRENVTGALVNNSFIVCVIVNTNIGFDTFNI